MPRRSKVIIIEFFIFILFIIGIIVAVKYHNNKKSQKSHAASTQNMCRQYYSHRPRQVVEDAQQAIQNRYGISGYKYG